MEDRDAPGFEDFTSKPPAHLLRRSKRLESKSFPPPPKKRKALHVTKATPAASPKIKKSVYFSQSLKRPSTRANPADVAQSSSFRAKSTSAEDIKEVKKFGKKYDVDAPSIPDTLGQPVQGDHGSSLDNADHMFGNQNPPNVMEVTRDDTIVVEEIIGPSFAAIVDDLVPQCQHDTDNQVELIVDNEPPPVFMEQTKLDIPATLVAGSEEGNCACEATEARASDELTKDAQNQPAVEGVTTSTHSKKVHIETDTPKIGTSDSSSSMSICSSSSMSICSSSSMSISEETNANVEAILNNLHHPITTTPLKTATQDELLEDPFFLRGSQLPTTLPCKDIVLHDSSKTPAQRDRMPSRFYQSPYLSNFSSSENGKDKMSYKFRQKFPFDGYSICDEPPLDLISDFCNWIKKGLLKTHAKKKPNEDHYGSRCSSLDVSRMDFVVVYPRDKNWFYLMSEKNRCWTDEHLDVIFYYIRKKSKNQFNNQYRFTTTNCFFKYYISSSDVARHERLVTNIIKGYCLPAGSPWHLVDEVYIPVNCDRDFHWVLAVVALKERLIRLYNSTMGSRRKKPPVEIQKLAVMLPTYLQKSGFFERTDRTDWSILDAYKDKESGNMIGQEIPFKIEFVQGIAQQESDSLDCGVLVAAYTEYISEGIPVPTYPVDAEYLRKRYAALLWKYGTDKACEGYVSENDDPPRPRDV